MSAHTIQLTSGEKGLNLFKTLLVFNLADLVFTLFYISAGMATEANPVLEFYYAVNPVLFVVVKNTLFCGGLLLLHRYYDNTRIQFASRCVFFVYLVVVAYHVAAFKSFGYSYFAEGTQLIAQNLIR